MSPLCKSIEEIARRFNSIIVGPARMKYIRQLAEECLNDPEASQVDLLYPDHPDEIEVEEPRPATLGQRVLALTALRKVYIPAAPSILEIPEDFPIAGESGGVSEKFARFVRWRSILDRAKKLGDYSIAWLDDFVVQLESDLQESRPAAPEQSEGEQATASSKQPIPRAEAEILVRDWLAANAKNDPAAVRRDQIANETGVSAGMVSATAAWKAFQNKRRVEAKPVARDIPLSDRLTATIPTGNAGKAESAQRSVIPDEVAALIDEQKADEAEQERRHKRRHAPS